MSYKLPPLPLEYICWQALHNEIGLFEAGNALLETEEDFEFSEFYSEAEVIIEMVCEICRHPEEREKIEAKYRDAVMDAFYEILDISTSPPGYYVPPVDQCHSIPRSSAQDELERREQANTNLEI